MIAVRGTAVDDPAGPKCGNRRLPQFLDMVIVARSALIGELGRSAEADAQHWRQSPRPQPLLLAAAVEQGRRLLPLAHPQGADALGAVDLVRRDRDEVGAIA